MSPATPSVDWFQIDGPFAGVLPVNGKHNISVSDVLVLLNESLALPSPVGGWFACLNVYGLRVILSPSVGRLMTVVEACNGGFYLIIITHIFLKPSVVKIPWAKNWLENQIERWMNRFRRMRSEYIEQPNGVKFPLHNDSHSLIELMFGEVTSVFLLSLMWLFERKLCRIAIRMLETTFKW